MTLQLWLRVVRLMVWNLVLLVLRSEWLQVRHHLHNLPLGCVKGVWVKPKHSQLVSYAQGVATAGSCACLIWCYTRWPLPPRIKLGMFVKHYTMEPLLEIISLNGDTMSNNLCYCLSVIGHWAPVEVNMTQFFAVNLVKIKKPQSVFPSAP